MNPNTVVTASAPGKVLIAGGYLVLESPNVGLVIAADKCFHTSVCVQPAAATSCTWQKKTNEGSCSDTSTSSPLESLALSSTYEYKLEKEDESESGSIIEKKGDAEEEELAAVRIDVHSPQFARIFRYWLRYRPTETEKNESSEGIATATTLLKITPRMITTDDDDDDESTTTTASNPFVEKTLFLTFLYIRCSMGANAFHNRLTELVSTTNNKQPPLALAMKLRADNDFYSQIHTLQRLHLDLTPMNVNALPPFLPCPNDGKGGVIVNKTGMGSSAALVTSLVASLLKYFDVAHLPHNNNKEEANSNNENTLEIEKGLRTCHNLSQICHCASQGKVGSGFDVSAAVYGSHVYTRFSKSVISTLLTYLDEDQSSSDHERIASLLHTIVNDDDRPNNNENAQQQQQRHPIWDNKTQPLMLPNGLQLLMADVCGGSESPSMARRVLHWKKENEPSSTKLWNELGGLNRHIHQLFQQLQAQEEAAAAHQQLNVSGWEELSALTHVQWKELANNKDDDDENKRTTASQLVQIRAAFLKTRSLLKKMGELADNTPIEPDTQTKLANATMDIPGVVAAGVPGAGGVDAMFVLYVKGKETTTCHDDSHNDDFVKSDEVRDRVGELWKTWKFNDDDGLVCPLATRGSGYGGTSGLCQTDLGW